MAKKSSGMGLGNVITSIIALFLVGGVVYAAMNVNNINSTEDLLGNLRSQSDRWSKCVTSWFKDCDYIEGSLKPGGKDSTKDSAPTKEEVGKMENTLKGIAVSAPVTQGYSRSDWKHWSDPDGNGCDSRQDTLKRDGTNITMRSGTACRVDSGKWVDPYSNVEITDPGELDIDHIIPLEYASSHGGVSWDKNTKESFANDPLNLIAASASENRKKGSKGPSEYMPPNKSLHCDYAVSWITVADKYKVSVTEDDKKELSKALATC